MFNSSSPRPAPESPPPAIEPLLLRQGDWQRFAVHVSPPRGTGRPRGSLIFVPAFAEEMNKARRTVALCSRALAAKGWSVLLLDPLGCGDSPGEFADATWEAWIDDIVRAHAWFSARSGTQAGIWAMRGGALLGAAALPRIGRVPQFLLWQPALSGEVQLKQFLRLKVAADAIGSSGSVTSTRSLFERLGQGESIEVAGYDLRPALALPIHDAKFDPGQLADRVVWLEVSTSDPPVLTQASHLEIEALSKRGLRLEAKAVTGPSFWLTQEIEECQTLIAATVEMLDRT